MREGNKEYKGKLDWSLVPLEVMDGVIRVFEKGRVKYHGTRTWLPGIRFAKLFAATLRHLVRWFYLKEDRDEESGEHPLCHVIANCMMLLTYIQNKSYDDRPFRIGSSDKAGKDMAEESLIVELPKFINKKGERKEEERKWKR